MKLAERIAAGALACAVTMCALTACGGGGGGPYDDGSYAGGSGATRPNSSSSSSSNNSSSTSTSSSKSNSSSETVALSAETVRTQQISAVNAARKTAGQNALTENTLLSQIASERLDIQITFDAGKISRDEYLKQHKALLSKYSGSIEINGKKINIELIHTSASTNTNISTFVNEIASTNFIKETEAEYVRCAVKEYNGDYYCAVVIGEPLKDVVWLSSVNSDGTVTTTGYHADGAVPSGDITFPSYISGRKVTGLNKGLGKLCDKITSVTIPGTIETLNSGAFEKSSSLKKVTIEDGVKILGAYAFKNCPALETVVMPDSITTVNYTSYTYYSDEGAFNGCSSLKNVKLSSKLAYISAGMFKGCTSLQQISLTESVSAIYKSGFYGCSSLKKIYIPKSTTYIGQDAFANCKNLTDIYYGGSQSDWLKVNVNSGNDYLTSQNVTVHYNSSGF